MAVITAPEIERIAEIDAPTTETQTLRERGGWALRPQPRVGLDLGSDDELLLIENMTNIRWMLYHNYHCLGIIDVDELLAFHIHKHGSLSARPYNPTTGDAVEYLTLPLKYDVNYVHIYLRNISKDVEIYDLRVA
jgi:hypothetical protein